MNKRDKTLKDVYVKNQFHLATNEKGFWVFGTDKDRTDFYGYPVQNCGDIEEVQHRLQFLVSFLSDTIIKYRKEYLKDNHNGWKIMIEDSKKELDSMNYFLHETRKYMASF